VTPPVIVSTTAASDGGGMQVINVLSTGNGRGGPPRCRIVEPGTGTSLKEDGAEALLILKFFVFFAEPLDAAGGIHQFLLAGEKRVALGTNFHANVFFRRSSLDAAAAGTLDGGLGIFRMNIGFHCNFNPLNSILSIHGIQEIGIILCSFIFSSKNCMLSTEFKLEQTAF
jgi:hypothetical protein